jgi:hypothetical protein
MCKHANTHAKPECCRALPCLQVSMQCYKRSTDTWVYVGQPAFSTGSSQALLCNSAGRAGPLPSLRWKAAVRCTAKVQLWGLLILCIAADLPHASAVTQPGWILCH